MSTLKRIDVQRMGELPSSGELGAQADGSQHLVLHISKSIRGFNKAALIKKLQRELPGHNVFANGSDADSQMIGIKSVVTKSRVTEAPVSESPVTESRVTEEPLTPLEAAFRSALVDYQSISALLIEAHKAKRLRQPWSVSTSEEQLSFRNAQSGQIVNAWSDGSESTTPGPHFVWKFLSTTAEYAELAKQLPDGHRDCARMIKSLDL